MTEQSFLLVRKTAGEHIELRVFVGPDRNHRALAGTLRFRPEEYRDFVLRILGAKGLLEFDNVEAADI